VTGSSQLKLPLLSTHLSGTHFLDELQVSSKIITSEAHFLQYCCIAGSISCRRNVSQFLFNLDTTKQKYSCGNLTFTNLKKIKRKCAKNEHIGSIEHSEA
jgi:hypothetical protein